MITYKGKEFSEVGSLKLLGLEGDNVLCECACSRKLKRPLKSIHEAIRLDRQASCSKCKHRAATGRMFGASAVSRLRSEDRGR